MKTAAVVFAGLFVLSTGVRADETKIPLKDVPKAVTDAFKAKFPSATIKQAIKETEDGKTTYEIESTDAGKTIDAVLTPDGKFTEIEREVALADLPKPVTAAVAGKYPKGTVKSAELATLIAEGKETTIYEVVVTNEGKDVEVKVNADGSLVK